MIKLTSSASEDQEEHGELAKDVDGRILKNEIRQLIHQINSERRELVKKEKEYKENKQVLSLQLGGMILQRKYSKTLEEFGDYAFKGKVRNIKEGSLQSEINVNMLSSRIDNPFCKFAGTFEGVVEKNDTNKVDLSFVKSTAIPYKKKISPYTSWVFVARNVRMVEDQSVIGKYQIYYNKIRGETVLCSDSEDEMVKHGDAKHDFTEAEDRILWMALEKYGSTEEVLSIIQEFVETTDSNIQGRYEKLKEKNIETLEQPSKDYDYKEHESGLEICMEKSLSSAIESFDNLFCRQCLIFDCPMHGSSQPLIYPNKKQSVWYKLERDRRPCSDQCYLMLKYAKSPSDQLSNAIEVNADKITSNSTWTTLERDLHSMGVEMFGKNSCLISRNLLLGLKTCLEVARYMCDSGELMLRGSISCSMMDIDEMFNTKYNVQEMPSNSRRKGNPKKFTNPRKSSSCPAWLQRESFHYKQYTPCGCQKTCGKKCPCFLRGTCCEKYCGCLKLCNNRFKGCHCVKSQCKTRHCPCFAANRECDPDVCRNCWVSCGDGTLGEPPRHGEGPCGNMNLLLGKKERILLANSNITGWGAFAKNPIQKNACVGEYTGELITHSEADKRGKVYIRIDHSFIFNLNDLWEIDARRWGDKLKFVNHSPKPNCYIKVLVVRGDHRVGIFAAENIEAGDEILYNYSYDLDCAPIWALPPPEGDVSKKKMNC